MCCALSCHLPAASCVISLRSIPMQHLRQHQTWDITLPATGDRRRKTSTWPCPGSGRFLRLFHTVIIHTVTNPESRTSGASLCPGDFYSPPVIAIITNNHNLTNANTDADANTNTNASTHTNADTNTDTDTHTNTSTTTNTNTNTNTNTKY